MTDDNVNHPQHYGGDTLYECIKVLEAWDWRMAYHFCVGNGIKYLSRTGKKQDAAEDLRKAGWYALKAAEMLERHEQGVFPVEEEYSIQRAKRRVYCEGLAADGVEQR